MRVLVSTLAALLSFSAAFAAEAPAGALSCSGCHPSSSGVEAAPARLRGMKAEDLVSAMQAFRAGGRSATVMDRIAKGFTEAETAAIAGWYAAQSD